jgi:hypothetical protein
VITDRLARDLGTALDNLPSAYDRLHLFFLPGGMMSDQGSRQRHGILYAQAPVVLEVLDLLDTREKPDMGPWRRDDDVDLDQLGPDGSTKSSIRRQGIHPTLVQWARRADADMWDTGADHEPLPDTPGMSHVCGWLGGVVNWLTAQDWMPRITTDVTRMNSEANAIIGTDSKIHMTCTNPTCGWRVEEQANGAYWKCKGCGKAWSRMELHKMAERKKPKTLAECAKLSNVSERTLRTYKAGGMLPVKARRGTVDLYDIDEIMSLTMSLRYRWPSRGRAS